MISLSICALDTTLKTPEIKPMSSSWEKKSLSEEYNLKRQMFLSFVLPLKDWKGDSQEDSQDLLEDSVS